MKVVFDTNVLLAAFITEGICSKLLLRARTKQFLLFTCPFILQELQQVLAKKFLASKDEQMDVTRLISEAAHAVVHPTRKVSGVCRDPDDEHILACALAAEADYLVTGDKNLLELGSFRGTQIVRPREFESLFND